ncbi:hypothetical protein [Bacteroides ovatus]|uniref:hypothetical protein n=1 Tax=Bacteroides ovatus TaxID=28116 RepID=UPI002165FD62|nr:hypothetical protein [Bacteroides ovatus]MCS2637519.1 hypothetical protein [Bacteroides ovatus]
MYNSRGLPSGGLQKLLPSDAYGSGSRPHPGTAGPQATAYAMDTLADDSRSYSRLISGSGCRSLTCRIQQRKQHPMRWAPLRTIAEVTPVLYPAPVAAPSLAEYSKGSSTLCDGHPFG